MKRTQTTGKSSRRKWIALGAVCAAVVLIAAAVLLTGRKPLEVTVHEVGRERVEEYFSSTAALTSGRQKSYYLTTAALVEDVFVQAGDEVVEGQRLASLDVTALELQLKQAKLQLENAELTLSAAKDGAEALKTAQDALDRQIAELERQIAALEGTPQQAAQAAQEASGQVQNETVRAALDGAAQRLASLDESDPASAQKLAAEVLTKLAAAQEQAGPLDGVQEQLEALIQKYQLSEQLKTLVSQRASLSSQNVSASQQKQLENALELAQLSADSAQEQYDSLKDGLVADFSGVVSAVNLVKGAPAPVGTACLTLASSDQVTAVITLGKYDVAKVKEGQQARISVPGHTYDGTVARVDRVAKTTTGYSAAGITSSTSLTAEIEIADPDENLIIGFEADVDVLTGSAPAAVALPLEAVKTDNTGSYCYVVRDGVAQRADLTFGISSDTYYEVTSGLKEGDTVILNPPASVESGKKVAVKR